MIDDMLTFVCTLTLVVCIISMKRIEIYCTYNCSFLIYHPFFMVKWIPPAPVLALFLKLALVKLEIIVTLFWPCLAKHCTEQDNELLILKSVKSDKLWYKVKKNLYGKVKKFCIIMDFFIWIVIKNYWCNIKSEKKVGMFWC
jgi:hypothetical protein